MENRNIRKIGQNLKYETIIFKNYDINLDGIFFDTMIAAHSIDSSLQSYSLDNLARRFLDYKMISYKDVCHFGLKRPPAETAKTLTPTGMAIRNLAIRNVVSQLN